nr:universal stress protein PHOS34-like isoform X1 [Ipomoea batatas]
MQPNSADSDLPSLANIKVRSSSPRFPPPATPSSTDTPTAGAQRKIGIAVDLSDESAFAVKWAVHHYLRPGDAVILLHVRPTSVLYGADWGSVDLSIVDTDNEESQQKLEDDFDTFTTTKATDLAQPLVDAQIPFKIHIVKDHDMKERLCLEVERLGLSAVIMGSRGFGATKRGNDGRLGSVSDYCVRHCVCPVVVVRYPDDKDSGNASGEPIVSVASVAEHEEEEEDEPEYHDAHDDRKDGSSPAEDLRLPSSSATVSATSTGSQWCFGGGSPVSMIVSERRRRPQNDGKGIRCRKLDAGQTETVRQSLAPEAVHGVGEQHAWQRSVLECLATRKFAEWTFSSQLQHRLASSESQYILAPSPHSSHFLFVSFAIASILRRA